MPENIFKLYRGKPNKSGERKGPGSWHNEPKGSRFTHIYDALSRYCDNKNDYDFLDLVWHIKNAVVGDIFFSEDVYLGIKQGLYWNQYIKIDDNGVILPVKTPETDQYRIIRGIIERTTLQDNRVFDDTFLEIRKWLGSKISGGPLVFEHIIPANIYLEELIKAYSAFKNKKDEFETWFDEFRKKIAICIVTKGENDRLNKWHHSMPGEYKSGNRNLFARYDDAEVNVIIHGRDIPPKKHNYNFEE